ncbi:MAG TPA: hypothetical protein VHZ55_25395 [Bryobacteraceae bacterium]|jgi:hypothetical protein|nr:hypothetical protein [Bryobacteraceae bacterium]
MDAQLVGTVKFGDFKAEVFSTNLPGEFRVAYQDPGGRTLEEAPLTGISSYRQRETEISSRLRELASGEPIPDTPYQGDAGEY